MYHYVRKFEKNFPNFRFLHVDDFKKQLNFFEKEYGFVSKEEWHSYIKGNGMGSGKGKGRFNAIGDDMNSEFDPLTAALRQMHDSVANEPIPDDFLDLLDMIDAKMAAFKKFQ